MESSVIGVLPRWRNNDSFTNCRNSKAMSQKRQSDRISKILLVWLVIVSAPATATSQIYTVLTFDAKGDGRDPSLADAAQLAYRYDKQQDLLWFRIALYGVPNENAFGVNVVIDTGADDATRMNWWGGNKTFKFDRLVTAWVTRGDNGYQGTVGVGDVAGVNAKQLNNLHQNNLQIRVEGDSIVIGVKRTDITDKMKMNVIAAVGSNEQWNDDLPNAGSAAIDLSRTTPGVREIDRKSTRLNSSHVKISYAVFCLKKKKTNDESI